MRAAAAVLLFAACLLAGGLARDALRRGVRSLEQLCLFLRRLRFHARMRRPLGAAITEMAGDPDLAQLAFLPECAALCRRGTPLPQAWRQTAEPFMCRLQAVCGQTPPVASYIPALAAADGRQVDALLELYEAQARDALEHARQRSAHLGRLCVQVGGAVGVLLGIMIL